MTADVAKTAILLLHDDPTARSRKNRHESITRKRGLAGSIEMSEIKALVENDAVVSGHPQLTILVHGKGADILGRQAICSTPVLDNPVRYGGKQAAGKAE